MIGRWIAVVTMMAVMTAPAFTQEPSKPGPEHRRLKKLEGTWSTTMQDSGKECKGFTTFNMELGGLWLAGSMEVDLGGGQKFSGRSADSYDARKKKYISVWFDSVSTTPLILEGVYDREAKAMILSGDGPDREGKPVKWKSVSKMPDDDTIHMSMYMGSGKGPLFTVTYKRKK